MDVVCENCRTEYEFDDAQVGDAGVAVKCTNCGYLFRVAKRTTAPQPPVPQPAPAAAPAAGWMLRTVGGDVYRLNDLATLQGWILDRKVTRDDEISRTGQGWKRLGEMPELQPFFDHVDRAVASEAARPVAQELPTGWSMRDEVVSPAARVTPPAVPPPAPAAATPSARRAESTGARSASATTGARSAASSPQWAPPDEVSVVLPRRRVPRWVVIAPTVIVIAGGAAFAAARFFPGFLSRGPGDEYTKAYAALLSETDDGWNAAESRFSVMRNGGDKALALAGLSALRAAQAQADIDDAEYMERRGKTAVATEKRRQAQARAAEARDSAQQSLHAEGDLLEANRAMADALRLLKSDAPEVENYLRAARAASPGDPETLCVEGTLRLDQGKIILARELLDEAARRFEEVRKRPYVRAEFRLAVLELREGNREAAGARLERVLRAQNDHDRAQKLAAEIASGATTGTAAAAATAAAPSAPVTPEAGPSAPVSAPGAFAPAAATTPAPAVSAAGAAPAEGSEAPLSDGGGGAYASLVKQGDRLSESGKSLQAAKLYQKALGMKPGGVEALTGLGYCAMDQGKAGQAIGYFKEALASDSSHGDALIGAAEAHRQQGDLEQALRHYRRYLAVYPAGPKARMAQQNVRDLEAKLPRGAGEDAPAEKPKLPEAKPETEAPAEKPAPDNPYQN